MAQVAHLRQAYFWVKKIAIYLNTLSYPIDDICFKFHVLKLLILLFDENNNFDQYNDQANTFCSETKDFEEKRARRPKRKADDSNEPAVVLAGKDKFRIDTFYVILDAIVADLSQRIQAYEEIARRCSFLYCDGNSTATTESIKSFVEFYSVDVNNELFNEWIQWRSFVKQLPLTETGNTGSAVTPQRCSR